MADRSRNRPANRPSRPAPPLTGTISVDDETAAALSLFNARLSDQAASERAQRRIDKARREKDQAATHVRALENDTKATGEQRTEAATAYKAALDALERAKTGEAPPAIEPRDSEIVTSPESEGESEVEAVAPPDAEVEVEVEVEVIAPAEGDGEA